MASLPVESLSEDYRRYCVADVSDSRELHRRLCDLERWVVGNGKRLSPFSMLPQLNEFSDIAHQATTRNLLLNAERSYDMDAIRQLTENTVHLKPKQKHVFDQVMTAVMDTSVENRLLFIDGPGGYKEIVCITKAPCRKASGEENCTCRCYKWNCGSSIDGRAYSAFNIRTTYEIRQEGHV